MRRQDGVVLINALVIVLVIASVAAALLTRAEGARLRAEEGQTAEQLQLYLDGAETLALALLKSAADDGGAVHRGQGWARGGRVYRIDRGDVAVEIADLQGRLNVNWLVRPDDAFALDSFGRAFDAVGLSRALLRDIAAFVSREGPRNFNDYLRRDPPLRPRGGPAAMLERLRAIEGLGPQEFAVLRSVAAALPFDTRLNLNTAPGPVLRAVLAPFPDEQAAEIIETLETGFIGARSEIRNRTIELLETEDIDFLPFDRITIGSGWFEARLVATLDGKRAARRVVFQRDEGDGGAVRAVYRWAEYD